MAWTRIRAEVHFPTPQHCRTWRAGAVSGDSTVAINLIGQRTLGQWNKDIHWMLLIIVSVSVTSFSLTSECE